MTGSSLRGTVGALARRSGLGSEPQVRPRSNGRLAFVGPMPPAATGIATYDRALLDGLGRIGFLDRHPMDVVWPIHRSQRRAIVAYELGVYQIGNNVEFHREVYRLAMSAPGLVVLHDLAIDGFVRELDASGDPLGRQAMSEAAAVPFRTADPDIALHDPLQVVWAAAVARAARGLVVHSEFCKRYLEAAGTRTPVFVVPHPAVEADGAIDRARNEAEAIRSSLAARGVRCLLVAPGDVNGTKQHAAILGALAGLASDVHLAIVGRPSRTYDIDRLIRRHGVGDRVTTRLGVPDDEFLAWLAAADVVVDLRYPHRGEVSGSLIRSMQLGKASIVSATGTYLDVPQDAVVRVAAGPANASELREAIASLLDDPARRERMGELAAARIRRETGSDATARGYERAITSTLELIRDPEHLVLERWARSLTELGVDETMVAEGYGRSYARGIRELRG
jgi:glycosyltransferase involved in cell wall biosynthesis